MQTAWPSFALVLAGFSSPVTALEQFPPPEFSQGYQYPRVFQPAPRPSWASYVDVAVLVAMLSLAGYLGLRRRRRRELIAVVVFSLLYFGFYRRGCICAVGALQNVALAVFDSHYALPAVAGAFFVLPLLAALLGGRVFCGAVCPLGAAQEIVLLRPVRVPLWLDNALGTFPYVYLGAAVLFAATGSAFVVCDYDPFVLFFRLAGEPPMLIFGICVLVISTVIGRPYCRYFCPFSVLLRLLAPFSKWRPRITPSQCVNCHLCADACPYGAIRAPTPAPGSIDRRAGRRQLALLLVLLPVLMLLGGWVTSLGRPLLARVHPTVRLANRLWLEEHGRVEGKTEITEAFELQGLPSNEVYREAAEVHERFAVGSWLLGGWLGLVLGLRMIGQSIRRHRRDYDIDPATCLVCARCYSACPVEPTKALVSSPVGVHNYES